MDYHLVRKKELALIGLTVSINANADIVDHGSYTIDPRTGLDWLDLTTT